MVNYEWKWSLLHFYLDAVATVHVLKAGNNDVNYGRNSNCTFCTTKIVVSFWENGQNASAITRIGKFYLSLRPEIPCDIVFIPSILKRYKEGGYRGRGLLFIGRLQSSLNFLSLRMRLVWTRVSSRVPLARKFSRYLPDGGLARWLKLLLLLRSTVFGRIVSRVFACHYII